MRPTMSGVKSTTMPTPCHLLHSLLFLLLMAAVLEIPKANGQRCFRRCNYCRNGIIDCTERSLLAPPREYPSSINTVVLSNNHIRFLGPNAFRRNTNIETLKIKKNRIIALRNRSFVNLPNLANLNLNSNLISRVHTGAFTNMNQLRSLFLSRNRIRRVAGLFNSVPSLYHLNLGKNKLRNIHENDFSSLENLYYLDLRHNRIGQIHPRAFANLMNLRHLFLTNNNITGHLQLVFGSTVLQLVDMSHCNLFSVPRTFPSSLTDLRLGHNNISMVNHTDFSSITNLRILAIEHNKLRFFADGALSHLVELDEVWLPNNHLVYIPRDLPPNVRRLHMGFNHVQILSAGLFGADSRLEFLSVENNHINRIHPNAFRSMRFLQMVNFQNNNIQRLEARTFNSLGGLHMISLNNNSLHTIEALAFRNMANLTNLHMNYIMSEPFHLHDNFLRQMLRLQGLFMMSSPGLAQALMNQIDTMHPNDLVPMSSMKNLDLSYNGLQWISSRVQTLFPNIEKIPLDGNAFRCSRRLSWLVNWMGSGSSTIFYNYENVMCDTPPSLTGRPLPSVRVEEMAVVATRRSSGSSLQGRRENPAVVSQRSADIQQPANPANNLQSALKERTRNKQPNNRRGSRDRSTRLRKRARRLRTRTRTRTRTRKDGRRRRRGRTSSTQRKADVSRLVPAQSRIK